MATNPYAQYIPAKSTTTPAIKPVPVTPAPKPITTPIVNKPQANPYAKFVPGAASATPKPTSFTQGVAQSIANPFLKLTSTATRLGQGVKNVATDIQKLKEESGQGYGSILGQIATQPRTKPVDLYGTKKEVDYGYLGKVGDIQGPKQAGGVGTEVASNLLPVGAIGSFGKGIVKGVLPSLLKTGGLGAGTAALDTFGSNLSEGKSIKDSATEAAYSAPIGAVVGLGGGSVVKASQKLLGQVSSKYGDKIIEQNTPQKSVDKATNNYVTNVEKNIIDQNPELSKYYDDVNKSLGKDEFGNDTNVIDFATKRGATIETLGDSGTRRSGDGTAMKRVSAKKVLKSLEPEIEILLKKRDKIFDAYEGKGINVMARDVDDLLAEKFNSFGILTPNNQKALTDAANYVKAFIDIGQNKDKLGGTSLKKMSILKSMAYEDSSRFKSGLEVGNSDVQDKVAMFARELIERNTPEPRIKIINEELGKLLTAKNFFKVLDDKRTQIKAPGGMAIKVLKAMSNTGGLNIASQLLGGNKILDVLTKRGFNNQIVGKLDRRIIQLKAKNQLTPLDERINEKITRFKNKEPIDLTQDELNRIEDLNLIGDEDFNDIPANVKAIAEKYKSGNEIAKKYAGAGLAAVGGEQAQEEEEGGYGGLGTGLAVAGGLYGGYKLLKYLKAKKAPAPRRTSAVSETKVPYKVQEVYKNMPDKGEKKILQDYVDNPKNKNNIKIIKELTGLPNTASDGKVILREAKRRLGEL